MNDAKLIWKLETQLGDARRELAQLETETLELKQAFARANMTTFGLVEALDQPAIKALKESK